MNDKSKNRVDFPNAAKIVDEFRRHFGDGVRLVYAKENGKEIGNPCAGENGGVWVTPYIAPKLVEKKLGRK